MKVPQPPFLELSFYLANATDSESFARLLTVLLENGASLVGETRVHRERGVRNRPFARVTDEISEALIVKDITTLHDYLADQDIRVIQVQVTGAPGSIPKMAEIVTYQGISEDVVGIDHHPVAILTDGDWLSGIFRREQSGRARRVGRQVYDRFRSLVSLLEPSYASITTEYGLECPADLKRDPRSLAFGDFFVSGEFIGQSRLRKIQQLLDGAYIESVSNGVYISCTAELNPAGQDWQEGRLQHAVDVARLVAEAGAPG